MTKVIGPPRPLLDKIAQQLNLPVGKAHFGSFPDGERLVKVEEDLAGETVLLVGSTGPPVDSNTLELALLADAVRRAGAARILAVIPYLGYSRSERVSPAGSPLACRVIADLLSRCGIERLVTLDLHASAIAGFFSIPVVEVSAIPILSQSLPKFRAGKGVIVSPDAGGIRRATHLASLLGLPLGFAVKHRSSPTQTQVLELWGELHDRDVILCDDIISTGGTLAEAAKIAFQQGAASVVAIATHAVMAPGAETRLKEAGIKRVVVTDSLETQIPWFEYVSAAPPLTETLRRLI